MAGGKKLAAIVDAVVRNNDLIFWEAPLCFAAFDASRPHPSGGSHYQSLASIIIGQLHEADPCRIPYGRVMMVSIQQLLAMHFVVQLWQYPGRQGW